MSPVAEADWQANVFVEVRTDQDVQGTVETRLHGLVQEMPNYKDSFSLVSAQRVTHPSGLPAGELIYTHVLDGVALKDAEFILWLPDGRTVFVTGSAVTALWGKYEHDLNLVRTSVRPL